MSKYYFNPKADLEDKEKKSEPDRFIGITDSSEELNFFIKWKVVLHFQRVAHAPRGAIWLLRGTTRKWARPEFKLTV